MLSCSHHCHVATHVTMQSFGDTMFFWQETHAHAFRCVSSNPLLRACPLVQPCSNYIYGIGDSNPGHTLWHIYRWVPLKPYISYAGFLVKPDFLQRQLFYINQWKYYWIIQITLKPDRFSCSQKAQLKRDSPVYTYIYIGMKQNFNRKLKGKHFPRQTRRSCHVWQRKLVSYWKIK